MIKSYPTKSIAVFLLASASLLPITGCETIERETGLNRSTQTGAAAGAAFGGIVAALADANPAWIAASVILGGVAGGAIGNKLGKDNAEKHARTHLNALDTLGAGQTKKWSDRRTGNSGSTRVTKVVKRDDGTVCKTYVETVNTVTRHATACRAPGG